MSDPSVYNWQQSSSQDFWNSIAPDDHVVQVYENDLVFSDALLGFVVSGLKQGEQVVVIAAKSHLIALEGGLWNENFDVRALTLSNRYVGLDSRPALARFMINGWPDEALFNSYASRFLAKARHEGERVRICTEMAALLLQQGLTSAAIQLEGLFNILHKADPFALFCAYPKNVFTRKTASCREPICSCHSRQIGGSAQEPGEVRYRVA
jgi:hypothetical protein